MPIRRRHQVNPPLPLQPSRSCYSHLQRCRLQLAPGEHGLLVKVHRELPGRNKVRGHRGQRSTEPRLHRGRSLVSLDLVEEAQQQVLGGAVLLLVASVKVDEGPLKVGRHLGQRPQLQQVQEVEILQPPCALALCLGRVKPSAKLLDVGSPDGTTPTLWGGGADDIDNEEEDDYREEDDNGNNDEDFGDRW